MRNIEVIRDQLKLALDGIRDTWRKLAEEELEKPERDALHAAIHEREKNLVYPLWEELDAAKIAAKPTGATKIEVYYRASGHLGQYEDWWSLFIEEGSDPFVEHSWDHVTVGTGDKREGSKRLSLEDALKQAPREAIDRIKEHLKLPA